MVHGVASRWTTLRGWSYRRLLIRASITYNRCYFLWWLQMVFWVVGGWGWSGFWGGWSGVKVSEFQKMTWFWVRKFGLEAPKSDPGTPDLGSKNHRNQLLWSSRNLVLTACKKGRKGAFSGQSVWLDFWSKCRFLAQNGPFWPKWAKNCQKCAHSGFSAHDKHTRFLP